MNSENKFQGDEIVIHSRKLTKQFGKQIVVDALDMDIPRGTIFGFIGPSGCGKTTTVRMLTGYYAPTSGELQVLGKDPVDFSKSDQEKIGYMNQKFILYPELTVIENLNFAASIYGVNLFRKNLFESLLNFVELQEHKKKITGHLSGGMQRRLSLASALAHDADLLFLDEPTTGIDPILRKKFWAYFKELQQNGRTLFITTQYVTEAEYCDLVGIMLEGQLLAIDTPDGFYQRAFGGEIISIKTSEPLNIAQRKLLETYAVSSAPLRSLKDTEFELVVSLANVAMPNIIEMCKGQGIHIETIEKKAIPFDDVFVKLIEEITSA